MLAALHSPAFFSAHGFLSLSSAGASLEIHSMAPSRIGAKRRSGHSAWACRTLISIRASTCRRFIAARSPWLRAGVIKYREARHSRFGPHGPHGPGCKETRIDLGVGYFALTSKEMTGRRESTVRPSGNLNRRMAVQLLSLALCGLTLAVSPLSAVTLVHRPYLQNLRQDRVSILWSTRENLTGTVQYSTDTSFSQSTTARLRAFPPSSTGLPFQLYQYQADLTGLAPGTDYFYRIFMNGENLTTEGEYRLHTAGPGPFSFLVFGDSGAGSAAQTQLALRMDAERPNFVIHVGDIAYQEGTFGQFTDNYFSDYATLMRRASFFAAAGNHEYYTPGAAPYLALHSPPTETVPPPDLGRYYSFDWADAHFIALDSNLLDNAHAAAGARMLDWLENDLATSRAAWRIVYFHHIPYPVSQHIDDPLCTAARERVVPMLERYGVQLVLTGHEHNYERSAPMRGGASVATAARGTVYISTGGGGGILHPVRPRDYYVKQASVNHYLRVEGDASQLTVRAIGIDGREFDRVTLTLPSLAAADAVVNAASFTTALAPGGLVSIFGQGLAAGASQATALPLPTDLSGSTVTLNGTFLPLFYASPTQINAQLPIGAQGTATLRVATASGSAETSVTISETAPAIFPSGVLRMDGTPVSTGPPVKPGDALVVYMTGLGAVDGAIPTGGLAPASPLLRVFAPIEVQLGEISVNPLFAGLTPGFVGLYQVNVVVPPNVASRVYPLRVSARGNLSNSMSVPVQSRAP